MTSQVEPTQADRSAEQPAVISAEGLHLAIDDRPILKQINLCIEAGSFTALLGHNGAGKSTLLHVIATLRRGYDGQLDLFGQPAKKAGAALRARIGLIGHQPMLYRDLTAAENLIFFGKLYGLDKPVGRAKELLNQVNLYDRATDAVKTFSRGMMQRLSIARALMHDPDLLLADEPFSGLDLPSSIMLQELMQGLIEQGKTIVLAHHEIEQALGMVQRVVLLKKGQVVIDQPTEAVTAEQVKAEVLSR